MSKRRKNRCKKCGEDFTGKSNHQEYCDTCHNESEQTVEKQREDYNSGVEKKYKEYSKHKERGGEEIMSKKKQSQTQTKTKVSEWKKECDELSSKVVDFIKETCGDIQDTKIRNVAGNAYQKIAKEIRDNKK